MVHMTTSLLLVIIILDTMMRECTRSQTIDTEFHPMPRTHAASQKGPLDGADPPSFSTGMVGPAQSSRDEPVNLTLQLTRRESSSVI